MEKVLVGLSGGVDSAAVALLLKERGWEVHGVYLAFCPWDDGSRAEEVARRLGIPFHRVNRRRRFQNQVVKPFVESYGRSETPNPCVECNRKMKFACLLEEADRLGIEKVATGHYASVRRGEDGRWQLCRGKDQGKDQSYFLWKLTQRQLSRILFPLAEVEKEQVRERAKSLVPPEEKESMEICFIPDGDTAAFLQSRLGDGGAGKIVDRNGKELGRHPGFWRYTVGQRRGLGVAMGERVFVTRIRPQSCEVELGREEELLCQSLRIRGLHFVSCSKRDLPTEGLSFQGRNRGAPVPCTLHREKEGAVVTFEKPVRRIACGQSACIYQGDVLLLGGEICE